MNNKNVMKQIVDFHKESLENCFNMMVMLQLQAENILNFFHYLPVMSDEGKKIMTQRTDAYKKWIDDLKKILDEGYARVEQVCNSETVTTFQGNTQKLYNFYLKQTPWDPQNWQRTLNNLDVIYKKGCNEFKKYVDDYIHHLKDYYDTTPAVQTKNKKKRER
ncbi:MAG: hypothetical protein KBG22_05350 [Smithella sp.]|nr:hypothetical protein [Smithella sp.]HQH17280.1 hypothetical protein [Smithella sp.]